MKGDTVVFLLAAEPFLGMSTGLMELTRCMIKDIDISTGCLALLRLVYLG